MPDSPSPAALTLARPGPRPASPARCPRCGSRLGALAAHGGGADDADPAPDRYCGCCGLVVPGGVAMAAAAPAAAGPGPR